MLAEASQLSSSPKASAFRQMKAWKVLWPNTRKTAYVTQPEETGRKSPCSWVRRSQPVLREGSLGGLGVGRAGLEGLAAEGEGEVDLGESGGTHPGPGGTYDLHDLLGGHQQVAVHLPRAGFREGASSERAAPTSWGFPSAALLGSRAFSQWLSFCSTLLSSSLPLPLRTHTRVCPGTNARSFAHIHTPTRLSTLHLHIPVHVRAPAHSHLHPCVHTHPCMRTLPSAPVRAHASAHTRALAHTLYPCLQSLFSPCNFPTCCPPPWEGAWPCRPSCPLVCLLSVQGGFVRTGCHLPSAAAERKSPRDRHGEETTSSLRVPTAPALAVGGWGTGSPWP